MFVVNILHGGGVTSDNKYDFGLIENEPLLRDLHTEDLLLSSTLEEANKHRGNFKISAERKNTRHDGLYPSPHQCVSSDKETHPGLQWFDKSGGGGWSQGQDLRTEEWNRSHQDSPIR